MIRLAARGLSATFEPESGHLPSLVINGVDVLHRAPWRDDPQVQTDGSIPMVDRRLGGTFVCAPFGQDDVDGGPPHGGPANAPWRVQRMGPGAVAAHQRFGRGDITAQIALRDGHPVLYQTHVLDLDAPCSFAHHPMIQMADGGTLSSNANRVLTFDAPTQEGTALYLAGQETEGFTLDTSDGARDWRVYPDLPCDDFLTLIHPPGLGWTAIARKAEGDTILMLKRSEQLPVTGLWLSNGARGQSPWRGRAGVLGIEDGRFAGACGFAAALSGQSRVPRPTVFPAGRHVLPHAIVHLPGAHRIAQITLGEGELNLLTDWDALQVPFETGHLA